MTDRLFRLTFITVFDLVLYPIVVGAVYAWLTSVHTPLRLYQRRMLAFVAIWFAGVCILSPLCVATALWMILPPKTVGIVGALVGLGWTWPSVMLVKRITSQRDSLSVETE